MKQLDDPPVPEQTIKTWKEPGWPAGSARSPYCNPGGWADGGEGRGDETHARVTEETHR